MRSILIIIAIVIVLNACKQEHVSKPDNLVSKEQMAAILYDVTIINAMKGVNKKKVEDLNLHLTDYIYKKHQIDSAQFATSNNYYAADPTRYQEIYKLVDAKLKVERKGIEEQIKADKKRQDSIQKKKREEAKKKRDSLPKKKFQLDKKNKS